MNHFLSFAGWHYCLDDSLPPTSPIAASPNGEAAPRKRYVGHLFFFNATNADKALNPNPDICSFSFLREAVRCAPSLWIMILLSLWMMWSLCASFMNFMHVCVYSHAPVRSPNGRSRPERCQHGWSQQHGVVLCHSCPGRARHVTSAWACVCCGANSTIPHTRSMSRDSEIEHEFFLPGYQALIMTTISCSVQNKFSLSDLSVSGEWKVSMQFSKNI